MSKQIVILDDARFIDATRRSMAETFSDFFKVVYLFETNNRLGKIKKSSPALILSINNAGITDDVVEYAEKNNIPVQVWFWDNPSPLFETYSHIQYFHSFDDALSNEELKNSNTEFLPFSTIEPHTDLPTKRDKGPMFLGTCWSTYRTAQVLAGGMTVNDSGESLIGIDEYNYFKSENYFKDKLTSFGGGDVAHYSIINHFSSLNRNFILNAFVEKGVDVFGGEDWALNLWGSFPELIPRCQLKLVYTHQEMKDLMSQYKVALNIFHNQNNGGGPNFRILDSAINGCVILSDKNKRCEEFFPHNEAGMYFGNIQEALNYYDEINLNDDLRLRLSKNAADVVRSSFTHKRRLESFCERANLSLKPGGEKEVSFVGEMIVREKDRAKAAPLDIRKTQSLAVEKEFAKVVTSLHLLVPIYDPRVIHPYNESFFRAIARITKMFLPDKFKNSIKKILSILRLRGTKPRPQLG